MSGDEIEKLKALEREATRGEWTYDYEPRANMSMIAGREYVVAGIPNEEHPQTQHANAQLILAARNALPRLLEERERLLEALRPFAEGAQTGTYRALMLEAGAHERLEQAVAAWDAVIFAEAPATATASGAVEP